MRIARSVKYAVFLAVSAVTGITFWLLDIGARSYGYTEPQGYFVAAFAVFAVWIFPLTAIGLVVKYRKALRIFLYEHPKDLVYTLVRLMPRIGLRVLRWFAKVVGVQLIFASLLAAYAVLGFVGIVKWQELHGTYFGGTLLTSYYWYQVVEIAVFAGILTRLTVLLFEHLWNRIRRGKSAESVEDREVPTVWVSEAGLDRNFGWLVTGLRWLISGVIVAGAGVYAYSVAPIFLSDVTGISRGMLVAITLVVAAIVLWVFARALGSQRHTAKEDETHA